jgi:hypothetical protein
MEVRASTFLPGITGLGPQSIPKSKPTVQISKEEEVPRDALEATFIGMEIDGLIPRPVHEELDQLEREVSISDVLGIILSWTDTFIDKKHQE